MSHKWRRSLAWDDEFFPPWAWPVKTLVRAFSSIWLAVIFLSTVALYGMLASVPIGLMVQGVTWLIYLLTLALAIGLVVVPGVVVSRRLTTPGASRFVGSFLTIVVGGGLAAVAWLLFAWPRLYYDPISGQGLMLFADFVAEHRATTIRRLPGMEMSELEFYSWWPLRVVLVLFVLNMMVATLRRIEFCIPNIGVLTVHSGIILIALGSVYYSSQKQEGDVLLHAGTPLATGELTQGPFASAFYDNTETVLYVRQGGNWEQRALRGVPRYNDYGLTVTPGESAWEISGQRRPWAEYPDRRLSLRVPDSPLGLVDPDISFRAVGYASYAETERDWVRSEPVPGERPSPLRHVQFLTTQPHPDGTVDPAKPVFIFTLLPDEPAHRVIAPADSPIGMEYTIGMPESRFADLVEPIPGNEPHGLVVELPGASVREVLPARIGERHTVGGYSVRVIDLLPEPPFPIITEGYRGAESSVAIVEITPPAGEPFTRYVYHRFPEINQDMAGAGPDGRPVRRDPDPAVRVGYIDASKMLQVYFDEREGVTRAIVRTDAGGVRVVPHLEADTLDDAIPDLSFRVATRWDHAAPFERPILVPEEDRRRDAIGTHQASFLAVEVSAARPPTDPTPGAWTTVVWIPFSQYLHLDASLERRVQLPDGRAVTLAFGRRQHELPGFAIALVDFEMISYDHRGAPRDYQSTLRVVPRGSEFKAYTHLAKLNAPLRAPFHWSQDRGYLANLSGRLASGLSPRQYKFSQASWDPGTWNETQQLVDAGQLKEPFVRFTILHVGNNPGIHVIALGGICMGCGIPWAFYIKPMIMKRRREKIREAVERGDYRPPARRERKQAGPSPRPAEVTQ